MSVLNLTDQPISAHEADVLVLASAPSADGADLAAGYDLPAEAASHLSGVLAALEAKGGLAGSVMVSDAFFPFRDGVDVALRQGVSAIAHPGGSLRDWESIEAVNQTTPKAAMVFTGQRAFKH